MELTAANVNDVFMDCLFREGEDTSEAIMIEGIVNTFGFHPRRLKSHFSSISALLDHLPDSFHEGKGGGMSFLNACQDDKGKQWGEHRNMEQLMCLGIAVNRAKYCTTRDMWPVFPGGVPYFTVLKREPAWFNNEKDSPYYGKEVDAKKNEAKTP